MGEFRRFFFLHPSKFEQIKYGLLTAGSPLGDVILRASIMAQARRRLVPACSHWFSEILDKLYTSTYIIAASSSLVVAITSLL